MIDMTVLVSQLVQLFLMICVGYVVFKIGILNTEVNSHVNSLVINVAMPLMIISSVLSMNERPQSSTVIMLIVVSIAFFVIMPFVAFIVVKLMHLTLHITKQKQGLFMFMFVFSNVGYMGMPILKAACGENGSTAVFYAAVLNIFFNLAAFTYGVLMLEYGSDSDTKTGFRVKSLLTPGVIASVLALVIYAFNIHFPSAIESVIGTLGDITSPLAMILVGSTLASMKLKEVFNEWRVYIFAVLKQFVLPIIFYPLFRLVIHDDLLFQVMFIEFLMPVANIVLMLATEHHLDNRTASKSIFITIVMSLVSIPLVMFLCGVIYG